MADPLFVLRIPIPPKAGWMNLNDRYGNWQTRHRLVLAWRKMTRIQWERQGQPGPQPPCRIESVLLFNRASTRDPHNFIATVKPIIDELVACGMWADDHAGLIQIDEPRIEVVARGNRGVILRGYPKFQPMVVR